MKVVHFAPFAPSGSGLYEAARDMFVADYKFGYDVRLVDVGATGLDGKQAEPQVGQKDERGDTYIVTADPSTALDADILVYHTGVRDNWVVKTVAPIIFVMHGRPASGFALEHNTNLVTYTLGMELAKWPRVKAIVSFWPYHEVFWEPVLPDGKLNVLPAPPTDEIRFSENGDVYDLGGKGGKWNVLIADCWRDDINTFEITHGAIEAAKRFKGIKFHFFALRSPLPNCWNYLFDVLDGMGALGVRWGRRPDMEEVYRAVDLVLSPQRIATRSITEPLCCCVPVIAQNGNDFATYTTDTADPYAVAASIGKAILDINNDKQSVLTKVKNEASKFYLNEYSKNISMVYEAILH